MIRTRVGAAVVLAICAAGLALACNKGPARAALAETEQALAAARPELERDAPSDLARITADTEAARRLLAAGEYTNALRIAQTLPERVARASERARARKSELTPAWTRIAASLPAGIEALRTRMAELDAARQPRGGGPAATEAAEAEIEQLVAAWAQAESAFDTGDMREAVRIGTDAQTRAAALAARIASPRSGARAFPGERPGGVQPNGASAPAGKPAPAHAQAPPSAPAQRVEPVPSAPASAPQPAPSAGDSASPSETPSTTPPETPETTVPSGRESR